MVLATMSVSVHDGMRCLFALVLVTVPSVGAVSSLYNPDFA